MDVPQTIKDFDVQHFGYIIVDFSEAKNKSGTWIRVFACGIPVTNKTLT